jgi:hypothetical protein
MGLFSFKESGAVPIGLLCILLDNEVSNQENIPIIFVVYFDLLGFCDNYDETSVSIRRWDGADVTRCILIPSLSGHRLHEWKFSFFPPAPPDKLLDNIWINPRPLPSRFFPTIRCYEIGDADSVGKETTKREEYL